MGEGESIDRTRSLMALVDAANVSCGVHAGSPETTRQCIRLAKEMGVLVGAHPGLALAGGRGPVDLSVAEFEGLLRDQLTFFRDECRINEVELHHVKLHGSLYHKVDVDAAFAEVYVRVLQDVVPGAIAFVAANSCLLKRGLRFGGQFVAELFADRAYLNDGSLAPRSIPGAVLGDIDAVVDRLRYYLKSGGFTSVDGNFVTLSGETLCVHSDTENSLGMLGEIRNVLGAV